MGGLLAIFGTIVALIAGVVALVLLMILLVRLFRVIGAFVLHVGRFLGGMIGDTARFVGAVILTVVLVPFIFLNVIIGRWSAASHYGTALKREIGAAGGCIYRVAIQHPLTLLGLRGITEGLESRLPQVMAEAPGRDKPAGPTNQYDGYTIIGSLAGGGSGAKLYVAEPDPMKRAIFERQGQGDPGRVVIKAFNLHDGSSLPQIVRESRSLDAAKELGLILEHELTAERFHYVMRFVPGESMAAVTTTLHAQSGPSGLDNRQLSTGLGYVHDLLVTLDTYHRGGLWHKDVKPDNIIVDNTDGGDNKAHLVDFGLVTPLRSAMTLTTHGTEYFRDPDLVRMAQKGVKVGDVDGAKFDIYAAGAVLYALIENSFPAHGGLSQFSKACPDSLRWIVRRSMASYDQRYTTAAEMLADLEYVRARGAAKVKPAELPSVAGSSQAEPLPEPEEAEVFQPMAPVEPVTIAAAATHGARSAMGDEFAPDATNAAASVQRAASPVPHAPRPAPRVSHPRKRPRLRVTSWWSGKYELVPEPSSTSPANSNAHSPNQANAGSPSPQPRAVPFTPVAPAAAPAGSNEPVWTPRADDQPRLSAAEQLQHARDRVAHRRADAGRHRGGKLRHARAARGARAARTDRGDPGKINSGVLLGIAVPLAALAVFMVFLLTNQPQRRAQAEAAGGVQVGGLNGEINRAKANASAQSGNGFELRGFGDAVSAFPESPIPPTPPSIAAWNDGELKLSGLEDLARLSELEQLGQLTDLDELKIELAELEITLPDVQKMITKAISDANGNHEVIVTRIGTLARLSAYADSNIRAGLDGHRVLVLNELAVPADPELARELGLALDALRSVGVELIGDVHTFPSMINTDVADSDASHAADDHTNNLIADARYRLGQVERQSIDARRTLAAIVNENDSVDTIILLAPELTKGEARNGRARSEVRAVAVDKQHGATRLIQDDASSRLLELIDRLVTYQD